MCSSVRMVSVVISFWIIMLISSADGAEDQEMTAYVGSNASLPCKVDTKQCGQLHSVKWYRDTSRIYVLSHVGGIARAEGNHVNRMNVTYNTDEDAKLIIKGVEVDDDAVYKCEITYLEVRENCDVVQIVKLTTLVKPESIRILNPNGKVIPNGTELEPMDEGLELKLICEVRGGKPEPQLSWMKDDKEESKRVEHRKETPKDGPTVYQAILKLTLSTEDLNTHYGCRVNSLALPGNHITELMVTPVVNVRPSKIELSIDKAEVNQGEEVIMRCSVAGAQPVAKITWKNFTREITNETLQRDKADVNAHVTFKISLDKDGTYTTTSIVRFKAFRSDNNKAFHCYAINDVMQRKQDPALHQLIILIVRYAPVVTVSPAVATANETENVLLLCHIDSNPPELLNVVWQKDGKNLTHNRGKYDNGDKYNPHLVILNATREDMGDYTCLVRNDVGMESSEMSVFVNVLHPPSVEVVMEPPTPVKAADRGNVTLVCNVTSGNPPLLSKVRWFLEGELMKELPECNYTSYDENDQGQGSGGPFCGIDPSILSLERVDETFAGNYTCQGRSSGGWGPVSDRKELLVYYPPTFVKLHPQPSRVIKGAAIMLECRVDHPGRPENLTYRWFKGGQPLRDVTTWNYSIPTVNLSHKTNFTCFAENLGGQSLSDTTYINVSAPPGFIQSLPTYRPVLFNSRNISLTCRVECSPLCGILWYKDGRELDTETDRRYYVREQQYQPDVSKNDFESIESTLYWNISAWPGKMLEINSPNTNYSCFSTANGVGPRVNSTQEIAITYPPRLVRVFPENVTVLEGQSPPTVRCRGMGVPTLKYNWTQINASDIALSRTEILQLPRLNRTGGGYYVCQAHNRYGIERAMVKVDILYAPTCTIVASHRQGHSALLCQANGNPSNVSFHWTLKDSNDTLDSEYVVQESMLSYLVLDVTVDTYRTYQCRANNSVGESPPCEIDVDESDDIIWWIKRDELNQTQGNQPLWTHLNQEKMIILIASSLALIVCVIVICLVIIYYCRRKRADTKYSSPLEMEERENPDGQSPEDSGTGSRWPLKPGVLVHLNGKHAASIALHQVFQQHQEKKPFKSKDKKWSRWCSPSKALILSRLRRFRDGLYGRGHQVPRGIKRPEGGVVTYKKFNPSSPNSASENGTFNPRKRKKPGQAPLSSVAGDKARLGAVIPVGSAPPLSEADNKAFYENLPFHGMQNAPNKPISIIAPFHQGRNPKSNSSSTKSLLQSSDPSAFSSPFGSCTNKQAIKRNQSFHGFQSNPQLFNQPYFQTLQTHGKNLGYFKSQPHLMTPGRTRNCTSQNLSSMQFQPNLFQSAWAFSGSTPLQNTSCGNIYGSQVSNFNPFSIPSRNMRVVGRRESDIRRTASGISVNEKVIGKSITCSSASLPVGKLQHNDKRFNSLELKKHKCYSPTFYSMRCKKHSKKRPIVYAVPKKVFGDTPLFTKIEKEKPPSKNLDHNVPFEDLSESIKIYEHRSDVTTCSKHTPVPAPRCRKHRKYEIIYQNVSKNLMAGSSSKKDPFDSEDTNNCQNEDITDMSNDSNDSSRSTVIEVSTTEAQVHAEPKSTDLIETEKNSNTYTDSLSTCSERNLAESINQRGRDHSFERIPKPRLLAVSHKTEKSFNGLTQCNSSTLRSSLQSLDAWKQSPVLKVTPNFVKPKTQSPKGALSLKIQAKRKSPKPLSDEVNGTAMQDKEIPPVPQMPLLGSSASRYPYFTNHENAFYTLTTPHYKQLTPLAAAPNTGPPPPLYSATLPHPPKRGSGGKNLLPRNLFISSGGRSSVPVSKSKSFTNPVGGAGSKANGKGKKHHFQIPIQKCQSFRLQTAESYFQPIRNIHEEDLMMRNGGGAYLAAEPTSTRHKHRHKGPLVVQEPAPKYPNGAAVYADLDMQPGVAPGRREHGAGKHGKRGKAKTEYATLKFDEVGQEIDV